MKKISSIILARAIAIALFTAVLAGTWDAWWHGVLGRESFWSPPHLLLYFSVIVAVCLGLYGYFQSKEKRWRNLALILLLIPLSGPFDELWHRMFGVEDLSSPLIIWSPPHLVIIFSIIASMVLLLPVLRKDSKEMQILFGSMVFAALHNLILFVLTPLEAEGAWHLLGFAGAGLISAGMFGILLLAQRWIPTKGAAVFTSAFALMVTAIGFNEKIAEGIKILPHEHAPPFLMIFSMLAGAVALDLLSSKKPWLRSAVAGFLWAGILYGFAWMFFKPAFVYSMREGIIAIISSIVGAALIGLIVSKINFERLTNGN
ncbi:MAG: hypothetical protein Q8R47_05220 [Nanoarchaeota archaeon]|nr:hypothetical protein [Nanoarchaeota archaeon]